VNNSYERCEKILNYLENYWIKVLDIVSGLYGNEQFNKSKLLEWMLRGEFKTPMALVKLPRLTFSQPMKKWFVESSYYAHI
jgi:hypothetical protein